MTARRLFTFLVLIAAVTAIAGCATSKRVVFEKSGAKVVLKSKRGTDLGLNQPTLIAPVRLSHILSRIDLRMITRDAQIRTPAIPLESLDVVAKALSKGLNEAGPDEHVIVYSVRRTKRFGIFDSSFLTSFTAYVKGDNLIIHLSRSDWEIPSRSQKRLPEPVIGKYPSRFTVLPSMSMDAIDQQSLSIAWKDKLFHRPTRTRIDATGKTVRKTILMESPEISEPEPKREVHAIPEGASSKTLRALADLGDQRQRGEISEVEYERKRQEVLAADANTP